MVLLERVLQDLSKYGEEDARLRRAWHEAHPDNPPMPMEAHIVIERMAAVHSRIEVFVTTDALVSDGATNVMLVARNRNCTLTRSRCGPMFTTRAQNSFSGPSDSRSCWRVERAFLLRSLFPTRYLEHGVSIIGAAYLYREWSAYWMK